MYIGVLVNACLFLLISLCPFCFPPDAPPRKSNPIVYQMSGPYSATNIVRFLQQHSTHPISTVSGTNRSTEGVRLADWSHEGWLLWIQAQTRILNLEKKNEQLYHQVKELEHQLANQKKPEEDYVALAKEKIDEMYAQLQHLIMQQFNKQSPSGSVPPPPSPPRMAEEEGGTTVADFMSGKTFAAEEQWEGSNPVCHSEACGQEEVGRQPKDDKPMEEGRQFNGDVRNHPHKSHKRMIIADDAGIVFDVPVGKAEEDSNEAPDGSQEEEREQAVHPGTRTVADDAGLVFQQRDRDGSRGNSGSMAKAVGKDPVIDAARFEDATGHDGSNPLDSLASRHHHGEYPLPSQEALVEEGDTHTGQAAQEALSNTVDSTPSDVPGSLTSDDSLSYLDPGQGDSSLSGGQRHRMGDLG